ncbi:hypothetical protein MANES_01G240250v8 [Manihot esculenta]|uniref:Uncharacterized protein n=1 Tax=Manihot esculenta TaxID=3983 RepID=A0ACB7IGY2_MANES|nr:hypothetical protein MANES_01G240250v8 [Manihot esculenta]
MSIKRNDIRRSSIHHPKMRKFSTMPQTTFKRSTMRMTEGVSQTL